MGKTYGVTRTIGSATYSNGGMCSLEAAIDDVYERAFTAGDWKPRELREKWWQIWLPQEHDEIEKRFIARRAQ